MWALEESCALRKVGQSRLPRNAIDAVSRARSYSENLRRKASGFGIFGDIFVTGHTFGDRPQTDKKRPPPPYPADGFIISKEFAGPEGAADLFAMCGACRANTTRHEIAGCCGTLSQWPDSHETEEQIQGIISRLQLQEQMEKQFPRTTPVWYGLWAKSPVPPESLGTLRAIISAMREEDAREMEISKKADTRQLRDFSLFAKATELAEEGNMSLHVTLLPLGHTDFGIYTVFPHCPFCKASARIQRWQRKYPSTLYECHVCGRKYSPSETATSKRMDDEGPGLREVLGENRFYQFAKEYLIAHGESSEEADAIVYETEAREKARQEKWREKAQLQLKKDAFLKDNVFAGIETVSPPRCFGDGQDEDLGFWFNCDAFAEVLRRCEAHVIGVNFMIHDSPDGNTDRQEMSRRISDPLALLRQWLSEGCNGKFSAGYNVPEKLVQ